MSSTLSPFERPRRWDLPFSDEMTDAEVMRLLSVEPFKNIKADSFPRTTPLTGLLKNDTRIRRYKRGEIIVREGDYGTSAFLILTGVVKVVLAPSLPPSAVGRREPARRGVWRTLAQLWRPRENEVVRRSTVPKIETKLPFVLRARPREDEGRIILQDIPRVLDEHKSATMQAGDVFGEIAALSRMPRTATIFALEDGAEMLEMRWQGLRDLMRYDTATRTHIDGIYRQRALASYLAEIPFMGFLPPEAKQQVMDATEFETYGEYDWSGEYKKLVQSGASAAREQTIANEGDYPNGVVMIRAGFARVTQRYGDGHRTLNYLGSGQLYGFDEIAHNWRNPGQAVALQYSLRVMGYTHVLVIPAHIIERVVLPCMPKEALPRLIETDPGTRSPFGFSEANGTVAEKRVAPKARLAPDVMEFLTENRYFNGTQTMFIDMDRCTRCDDCVRACAATHDNNPRFLRHGPIHNNIMVAQACMHCADPVCMIGCPTGAIHRDAFEGEVVINPKSCIGCGTCASNCPYEAIRMVEQRDERGRILVAQDAIPILKATKCDLCIDQYGGPACERACPHDALKRIDLNTPDALAAWLKR